MKRKTITFQTPNLMIELQPSEIHLERDKLRLLVADLVTELNEIVFVTRDYGGVPERANWIAQRALDLIKACDEQFIRPPQERYRWP